MTDTLGIDGPVSRETTLEYLKINSSTPTHDFFYKKNKCVGQDSK